MSRRSITNILAYSAQRGIRNPSKSAKRTHQTQRASEDLDPVLNCDIATEANSADSIEQIPNQFEGLKPSRMAP